MTKRLLTIVAALLLSEPAHAQGYQFTFAVGSTVPLGSYGVGAPGKSARFSIGKRWPDQAGGVMRVDLEGYDVLAPTSRDDVPSGRTNITQSAGIGFTWLEVGAPRTWRRYALYGVAWHDFEGSPITAAENGLIVVRAGVGVRGLVQRLPLHVEAQAMTWLNSVGTALLFPVSVGIEF